MLRLISDFVLIMSAPWLIVGCGDDEGKSCEPETDYAPVIVPADFVDTIDNALMPLAPGSSWSFAGGDETIEVVVTDEARDIMGVTCVVVRDTVSEGGDVVEDTFDWYAQDRSGNVWYMGEDSREMEGGEVVSTAGSWEAGVDGALPGYMMLANPIAGLMYRQEYYACEAEDMAEIVSLDESVSVPAGDFDGCVKFHEWTPLEEDSDEYKYFCPGVGVVLEIDTEGVRVELVEYTIP
jgi:hypothetical protein